MGDDSNSHSLHKLDVHFNLHLHPSKVQDIMEGVREQLNALLLRYNEDLEGVLLSYCRERLVSKQASLHPYFPYLQVTVRADVVLFRPVVGSFLVGRVNKVGEDYLGLLVLGVFNASIGAKDIRGFKRNAQSQSWINSSDSSHVIGEGSPVRFKVKAVLDQVNMFSMSGSLKEPGTGLLGHPSTSGRHAPQDGAPESKHKRRKRMVRKSGANGIASAASPAAAEDAQHAAVDAGNGSSKQHKKEKKRKRQEDKEQQPQEQQRREQHQQQQQQQHVGTTSTAADANTPRPAKKKHKSKHKG